MCVYLHMCPCVLRPSKQLAVCMGECVRLSVRVFPCMFSFPRILFQAAANVHVCLSECYPKRSGIFHPTSMVLGLRHQLSPQRELTN